MKKKYKVLLFIIAILILIVGAIFLVPKFFKPKESEPVKVVDSIDDFSYTLEDRDTNLMKEVYNELKALLKSDDKDKKSYAEVVAKLFVIDLFTIENKRNKYDVGGVEFVYPDAVSNYKINVEDTLYKTVKNDSNGKRKQSLPVVRSVSIDGIEESTFKVGDDKTYDSFVMNVSWNYEKDLGYDKSAVITCAVVDDLVYVMEYKVGE